MVLTGTGKDGAMGVRAIKKMGGSVIVQDAKTFEFFGRPGAAIQTGSIDFIFATGRNRLCPHHAGRPEARQVKVVLCLRTM
jgi:chemotaxis response regulator CheB